MSAAMSDDLRPTSTSANSHTLSASQPARSRDHRTTAIVLRRVNYGEADRIIDLLTPEGPVAVLAKSVRKEKSKLAGGVELFCLSEITYHEGRSSLATLTGAKMLKFYSNLLTDFNRMNLASTILKDIARATRQVSSPDFFALTRDTLSGLNTNLPTNLVELYFKMNLARLGGEEPNFRFDADGQKLVAGQNYTWDLADRALVPDPRGIITTDDIKVLRLILSSPLLLVSRVNYDWTRLNLFRDII